MVVAGSTSEYGIKDRPMREGMLLEPTNFYGAAKAAATLMVQVWAKRFKLPVVIARFASVTGVGEQSVHLIPTLIRSCLKQEPMSFIKEPMHDYINVLDICSALEILSDKANNHKGEIFNIGRGYQMNNKDVLEIVETITNKKANIVEVKKLEPIDMGDVWMVDNRKMILLGWKPGFNLGDTIAEMVEVQK
jgi:nucleoside-diphosphate-sugar epimerase